MNWNEAINTAVRPIITVVMMGTFCYLTLMGTIGADVFVPVATLVLTWWFKSRDEVKGG